MEVAPSVGLQSDVSMKPNHLFYRNLRRSKPDLFRLATYRTWKENCQSHVSPALLSKMGFSYTGQRDRVKCDTCSLTIESWKPGMDPKQEHLERSPDCPFVKHQTELFSRNDSSVTGLRSSTPNTNVTEIDARSEINLTDAESTGNHIVQAKPRDTLFIDILSPETIEKARTATFSNWPSISPSIQDMVNAGFWFTNIADRVICIHCDVMFHSWTENDRPYDVHRLKSPDCLFVRTTEKKATNRQHQLPVANSTIANAPNGQTVAGAIHADYSLICRRRETFQTMPESVRETIPSADLFADAGFFHTGEQTIVRCFYCNGALRNWQKTDDPKIEHARWFPQCAYIRQFIGENLYQAIQRKNRELRAQQNLQETTDGKPAKYIPWTDDEIDRMVKARLDLPIVEQLRRENISMAVIRKVFDMQLRFKKDDFKADLDLRVACLILQKQVKLINGNEANILIPQNWMRNYFEQQQNQTVQTNQLPAQPEIKLETPVIQTNITQKPASSETRVERPRQLSKSDLLCSVCLTTERQVACLPCGHLTSCVACGHSLKTCPFCRAPVKAFVRIYT